jgi:hypothetical protein
MYIQNAANLITTRGDPNLNVTGLTGLTGQPENLDIYDRVVLRIVARQPHLYGGTDIAQYFGYINDAIGLLFGLMVSVQGVVYDDNYSMHGLPPWATLLSSTPKTYRCGKIFF